MTKAIFNSAQILGNADIGAGGKYAANQGYAEQFGSSSLSVRLTEAYRTCTTRVPYALCRQRRSSIEARALRRLPSSYGISVSLKPVIRNYLREIIGPQKHIA